MGKNFRNSNEGKPRFLGTVPAPPEFLLKPPVSLQSPDASANGPTATLQGRSGQITIDLLVYQQALEDRKKAEISFAEVYSKCLEMGDGQERVFRRIQRYERLLRRVREIYNRALKRAEHGDETLLSSLQVMKKNVAATEKAMADLQLENETLRISLHAHEEGMRTLMARLAESERKSHVAHEQFSAMSDEYENRGILLAESERKIRSSLNEIEQLNSTLRQFQLRHEILRDEAMLKDNQLRELQLREAAVSALNSELTSALTKSQKQVHVLEDRMKSEKIQLVNRIVALEEELGRATESRRAEDLIEASRKIQQTEAPQTSPAEKMQDFYGRWSQILGELSSHSTPIGRKDNTNKEKPPVPPQLLTEHGDLEII